MTLAIKHRSDGSASPRSAASPSFSSSSSSSFFSELSRTRTRTRTTNRKNGFTLIELILVLALLAIVTSLMLPRMSGFIRGRALDAEARRLFSLIHAGQSRAVSEGMPMALWIDEKESRYGLEAETTGPDGDPKIEQLTVDETLQISIAGEAVGESTLIRNLPALRFLPDGTIDEKSPKTLKLTDYAGASLWLVQSRNRTGYEVHNTEK